MFGKLWEMKKLYDKYRTLQKALKNLIIRAKEWKFNNTNGEEWDAIIADISWEMKLIELNINDISLLDPANKKHLEEMIVKCIQKAQDKAQQVVAEKTKEILGFDPSDMANMMWWWWMPWMPGLN